MSIKRKLIYVFIISTVVFGSGGAYFYNLLTSSNKGSDIKYLEYYESDIQVVSQIDFTNAKLSSKAKSRSRKAVDDMSEDLKSTITSGINVNSPANGYRSPGSVGSTSSSYSVRGSSDALSDNISSSAGGLLANAGYGGISSKRSSFSNSTGTSAVYVNGGSASGFTSFFGAPTASGNNAYLVDPSALAVTESQRIAPIGDGVWLLVVFGLIYFAKPLAARIFFDKIIKAAA